MPLIQTKGLTKLYRMGESVVRALDAVDLKIERGEFVAITGPSGSGKSTIMHLLGCLDRPTSGTYLFNGRNVGQMSDGELAKIRNKSIGFVFQTFNLINRTSALENVGVPLFYARRPGVRSAAGGALERVGLSGRVKHTPAELSGGERQRVAIARAIVNDPVLLLADEPTGNLDSRTGEQIMEIFRSLNEQGVTIVLVTHEHDVAVQAKRVVHMRDGKIVSDRFTSEILADESGGLPASQARVQDSPPAAEAVEVSSTSVESLPVAQHASEAAVDPKPRVVAGASGALGFGAAGPVFLTAAIALLVLLGRTHADLGALRAGDSLPPALVVLALVVVLCLLLAVVAGFVGIFWGRAVLRRIRTAPGTWGGKGRARAAWICGLVTVLVPVALVGINIVARALGLSR